MTAAVEAERRERLRRANEIRNHRRRLKRRMAAGEITLAEVLRDEDPMLDSMLLADLLMAHLTQTRREELLDRVEANHPRIGTGRMTVVEMEAHIADLSSRVEGLETLLAGEEQARSVERAQQRPSPAWGRD